MDAGQLAGLWVHADNWGLFYHRLIFLPDGRGSYLHEEWEELWRYASFCWRLDAEGSLYLSGERCFVTPTCKTCHRILRVKRERLEIRDEEAERWLHIPLEDREPTQFFLFTRDRQEMLRHLEPGGVPPVQWE